MEDAVIKVEHLKKYFPVKMGFLRTVFSKEKLFVRAVDDVSFEVYEGEIFGMVGPNGAGKTTTIECIEGLRRPDGGHTEVLGLDPQRDGYALRERDRSIGRRNCPSIWKIDRSILEREIGNVCATIESRGEVWRSLQY